METSSRHSMFYKAKLHKYICIAVFLMYIVSLSNAFGSGSSLSSSTISNSSSSSPSEAKKFSCANLTNSKQRTMCYETSGLLQALIDAEKLAKEKCEEQFEFERWNCYGFAMLTSSNVTKYATSESAYLYAAMTASLAHVVTQNCQTNGMKCPCGENTTSNSDDCPLNYEFGAQIASEFMSKKEITGSVTSYRQQTNLHNIKVGISVFLNENYANGSRCNCAGVSASCSVKSCYTVLVEFNTIAAILKNYSDTSCKVSVTDSGFQSECGRTISNTTLIYTVNSPDYCHKDIARGSPGVSGRLCDPTSSGKNNCNTLCCGRGHDTYVVEAIEQCCTFVYCCRIVCKPCSKVKGYYYVCK